MAGSLRGVTIVEMETGLAAYRSTSELRRVTEGGGEDVSLPPPTDFILQFGASDSAASLMAFGHHASSFADDELAYPSVGFALYLEAAPTWLATRIWMTLPERNVGPLARSARGVTDVQHLQPGRNHGEAPLPSMRRHDLP